MTQLFTAATELNVFKSVEAWHFHNAPYGAFFKSEHSMKRWAIPEIMQNWSPRHRIIWVGDACMAPYELLTPIGPSQLRGIDWIQRINHGFPRSVWLNPEPQQYWNHMTIAAVSRVVPMFPLTLAGLRDAIGQLRAGASV